MKYYNFDQKTDAWLQCRVGKITASRAKDARSFLKSGKPSSEQTKYAAQVAVERLAGRPIDKAFQNWQMQEGVTQEPIARAAYEAMTGDLVEEVGAIATDDEIFLYSPDGLVGNDGLLEIKCLFSPDRILQIIAGEDYSDFMDQCMFGLWITGRYWIDLCIWCPALEPIGLQMRVIRIERNENDIEKLEADLTAFAGTVRMYESALRKAAIANKEKDTA